MARKHGRQRRRMVALRQVERRIHHYSLEIQTADGPEETEYWELKLLRAKAEAETLRSRLPAIRFSDSGGQS